MSAKPPSEAWLRVTNLAARLATWLRPRPAAPSACSAAPVSSIPDGPPRPAKLKPPSSLACAHDPGGRARGSPGRASAGRRRAGRGRRTRSCSRGPANEPLLRCWEATSASRSRPPRCVPRPDALRMSSVRVSSPRSLSSSRGRACTRARSARRRAGCAGGGEPERGPARVELRRRLPRRGAPAAVVVLGVEQVLHGRPRRCGVGRGVGRPRGAGAANATASSAVAAAGAASQRTSKRVR